MSSNNVYDAPQVAFMNRFSPIFLTFRTRMLICSIKEREINKIILAFLPMRSYTAYGKSSIGCIYEPIFIKNLRRNTSGPHFCILQSGVGGLQVKLIKRLNLEIWLCLLVLGRYRVRQNVFLVNPSTANCYDL